MTNYFNLLITSLSKKVPLVKAARTAINNLNLKAKIFGADSHVGCIASYFVDEFWTMPRLENLTVETLIRYCKDHQIKGIIPTRDGELPFFAKHREALAQAGIACMISSPTVIETCANKLLFYQTLSQVKLPVIPTATDLSLIPSASYVVKECFGAGSHTIGLNLNASQAKEWSTKLQVAVFQPYIEGKEYSIDLYIDRQHSPHGALVREREFVANGESQITSSVQQKKMEALCLESAAILGIYGHAVFQVICDASNELHLVECNARFGGASTLSIAMGLHSFEWFIQESLHQPLPPFVRSAVELRQIRYAEDKVIAK